MAKNADTSGWFTLAGGADQKTAAAIYRGALSAQRSRIEDFSVDVLSDAPWPPEVSWAVAELDGRLQARRARVRPWLLRWLPRDKGPTVDLLIADEHDFALAMAIAPFTICGTGISDRHTIIWDGNDTGTSGAFCLTDDEADEVRRFMSAAGVDPAALIPLRKREGRGS